MPHNLNISVIANFELIENLNLIVQVVSFQRGEFPIKSQYQLNMIFVICASIVLVAAKMQRGLYFQELTI